MVDSYFHVVIDRYIKNCPKAPKILRIHIHYLTVTIEWESQHEFSWLTASHKVIIKVSARGAVILKLDCERILLSALSCGRSQDSVAYKVLIGALSYFLAI